MGWALNGTTSSTVTAGTNSGYIPVNLKFTTGGWNLAGETRYIYDGMTVVQERDQNNVPLVTYTRGNDLNGSLQGAGGIGGLLARTDQTASTPSHAYYHADGNGNITAMVSFQQNLVAKYLYDPYGNILAKSGLLADANVYRFSSKEWHAASAFYYYWYRFFSPNLQRWPNRDPFGKLGFESIRSTAVPLWKRMFYPGDSFLEINRYKFVDNSPVDQMDYFGLTARPTNPNRNPDPNPDPNPSPCGDFTNKTCTDACKSIYGTNNKMLQACITVCKTVGGKSCRSLFAYCEHLMRHGAGNPAKACMTVYDELCLGE